ncbi:MAG: hypothetical protein GF401_06060 [Chitinivibrionales bacterium]|nr:hypothetical protein [Chitinivibrionales bacterium]
MDMKLFFSTFSLIFLAELGDKTQLASFAASAGSKSPLSVFAGAASALVLATLIAVATGSFLQKAVPIHYLKGGAAVLFIVFGIILLANAFQARAEETAAEGVMPKAGVLSSIILDAAAQFEEASAGDYHLLAQRQGNADLRELFLDLAREEEKHIAHIRQLSGKHPEVKEVPIKPAEITPSRITTDRETTEGLIQDAIEHERQTSAFYSSLARDAKIPSVRATLMKLAGDERQHIKRLEEFRGG